VPAGREGAASYPRQPGAQHCCLALYIVKGEESGKLDCVLLFLGSLYGPNMFALQSASTAVGFKSFESDDLSKDLPLDRPWLLVGDVRHALCTFSHTVRTPVVIQYAHLYSKWKPSLGSSGAWRALLLVPLSPNL
jgi:hypothetical protein